MKILGKINNLYKKFGTENKAILELEIDKEGFYEAQKSQTENLPVNIEFNPQQLEEEKILLKEIKGLIIELAEYNRTSFKNEYDNLIKKYGIYTVVFIRKDCTKNLLNFWKEKHPYSQFKIISGDSVLEEIWLYKDLKNYEEKEIYNFIYNLVKECKKSGIEYTEELDFYAKIGELNDK